MARFLGLLLLLAIVLYGIWPYYSILRINSALAEPDAQALSPIVDLAAIQSHYKTRINSSVEGLLPNNLGHRGGGQGNQQNGGATDSQSRAQTGLQLDTDQVLGWLSDNLKQLGDRALDQAITLDWVRSTLLAASRRAAGQPPGQTGAQIGTSFIDAVDFAFFESWDRFVIRLGRLGQSPTFVILTLDGTQWRVTDITG